MAHIDTESRLNDTFIGDDVKTKKVKVMYERRAEDIFINIPDDMEIGVYYFTAIKTLLVTEESEETSRLFIKYKGNELFAGIILNDKVKTLHILSSCYSRISIEGVKDKVISLDLHGILD